MTIKTSPKPIKINHVGPENLPHCVFIDPRDVISRLRRTNPIKRDNKPIRKTAVPMGSMTPLTLFKKYAVQNINSLLQKWKKVLEEKDEIDRAQELFMKNLDKFADRTDEIFFGYQGESHKSSASWSKELNIWWVPLTENNRYWNAFGTGEPRWNTRHSHDITCEINPPYEGINRSIAGVFAKDSEGKLFLLHRGRIG